MGNKFDELAKGLAQSATRRQALKRFGIGVAGLALACLGLANTAKAAKAGCKPAGTKCTRNAHCCSGVCDNGGYYARSGFCR